MKQLNTHVCVVKLLPNFYVLICLIELINAFGLFKINVHHAPDTKVDNIILFNWTYNN